MKIDVDIESYLSGDDIKAAIISSIKEETKKFFKTEKDIERIISNSAFSAISSVSDEFLDGKTKELIEQKVNDVISDLSSFTVFKQPSAWDREPNNMHKFLQTTIESKKELIDEIITKNIEAVVVDKLKDDINEFIIESVQRLFIGKAPL